MIYRIACGQTWAYITREETAALWRGRGRRVEVNDQGMWREWS